MKKNVWHDLAKAPRKSYLARVVRITPVQERWVKSILNMWGDELGGRTGPECKCGVIGRLMVRDCTDSKTTAELLKLVNELHALGYKGKALIQKGEEILTPKRSVRSLIDSTYNADEAAFVDSVISAIFKPSDPIRAVAIKYYCDNRSIQNIADYLATVGGIMLTNDQSRDRVRWCLDLFNAKIYRALKAEMEKEKLLLAA